MAPLPSYTDAGFDFLKPLDKRETSKPRKRGLTGILDFGLLPAEQESLVDSGADFIDLAKISGSTSAIFPRRVLDWKIDNYRKNAVQVCVGGQMYECAYHKFGDDGVSRLIAEAKAIGFDSIEISDTMISVDRQVRAQHICQSIEAGLDVIGETGSVDQLDDIEELIKNLQDLIDTGCSHVIVEGMQIVGTKGVRVDLLDALKLSLDIDKVFFELPWVGHTGITQSTVESIKTGLVAYLGHNVNISNVPPLEAIETEGVRLEIDNPKMWL